MNEQVSSTTPIAQNGVSVPHEANTAHFENHCSILSSQTEKIT